MNLVLELLGLAFLVGNPAEDAAERARERRRSEVRQTLEAVAFALFGRYRKPWFRAPRATGRIDGREVEVVWLGLGRIQVRAVARETTDLHVRSPGWLARTFSGATWSVTGETAALHADARRLAEAGVDSLSIAHGQLEAVVRCRLDAGQIEATVRRIMALAWAGAPAPAAAEPAVVVKGRDPAAPASTAPPPPGGPPPRSAESDLRCPFCHDAMGAVVVRCESCDAPHHPSCFEEGHGCSIAGCKHQRAKGSRVQA